MIWQTISKYASPKHFYRLSATWVPVCGWLAACLFIIGLIWGLVYAPADYQQGDGFRIIYVHVPSAWMSLFIYVVMAACGAVGLIWKTKVSDSLARACAPVGASFTFLTLITGSLWGKPMWGTWWTWDPRLTSELVLLFLYLGYIALQSAIAERRMAAQAGAILALAGVVNIPIIHYSVVWWSSLHQGPSVSKFAAPSIHTDMLIPLLLMASACMFYFAALLLLRARCELLENECNHAWVSELLSGRGR
ncbi:MAG: heme ABC transporter permease [Gammaproteobacteria bacterium]